MRSYLQMLVRVKTRYTVLQCCRYIHPQGTIHHYSPKQKANLNRLYTGLT